jgi:4-amino-4-deoxy-L-arabinose transferase-like glycosyltransferase
VLGLGLENKISVLWLGAGIAAGLLATPARRLLLTPGPWLAGAIAAALFAPHIALADRHWMADARIHPQREPGTRCRSNTPLDFVAAQVMN